MAASAPVPVYTNLHDLYGSLGTTLDHASRWNNLAEEFEKRFGRKPAYIARAPGRVNIIGEHIDYCLFGVLPAAVERDILIACAPRPATTEKDVDHSPGTVIADNLHPKYARQTFTPVSKRRGSVSSIPDEEVHAEDWHMDINTKELRWESYVKAGYFGVLNRFFSGEESTNPIPVDLLVTGTVPAGSGLSSSAAMVVASTLAFLAVNGRLEADTKITKGELVSIAVQNEKRVGVNSGGMDQAASVVSNSSSALYISFFPTLEASPISLPSGAVFVCTNSLVVADKAVTAKTNYNLRVVETLASARILAKRLDVKVGDKEKVTLREVVGRYSGETERGTLDIDGLIKALEKIIPEVDGLKSAKSENGQLGVTLEEMVEMSGLSSKEFHDLYLSWVEVEATHFQLYKRSLHVFTEALRVLEFRKICERAAAAGAIDSAEVLEDLGRVMNNSQTSCNELFDCSCPELNQLTELARSAGAYGSRLTGAGWGGCTVSLVPESQVDSFIQKVKDGYPRFKDLEGDKLNEVIFATKPSSGACVYKF